MFVDNRGSLIGVVRWQWRDLLVFGLWATAVVAGSKFIDLKAYEIPALPLSVAGAAIGIFASFRTNSAYDRWWEGRKLWGRLVNTSRHITSQAVVYLGGPDGKEAQQMVRRQAAYVHLLRCLNRLQNPYADDVCRDLLEKSVAADAPDVDDKERNERVLAILAESNPTHTLLDLHLEQITRLADAGAINEYERQSLDESVRHLLDIQGGTERIKKTPFPVIYGFFVKRLIHVYAILLPLGLVHDLGWGTVVITLLVCSAFQFISEVGRVLEDPFSVFWPALPLQALSTTIETNIRQRIGDGDLPAALVPDKNGVLM